MASNSRTSGTAALRYANALADLAFQSNTAEKVEQDARDVSAMIAASSDFRAFLKSPLVDAESVGKALREIAAKAGLSDLATNLLLTLAKNKRLADAESVFRCVAKAFASRRGEMSATVESAESLSEAQAAALSEKLGKDVGRPVSIEAKVNKDLIGGVVVTLGSLMVDDSVSSKIDRMGRAMKSADAA